VIRATAAVGGPHEANGALTADFDLFFDDLWLGQDSFEKAEQKRSGSF
jgi:stage V sporulation protein AD